jgi:DNA-binding MarR family transcriptional regulator
MATDIGFQNPPGGRNARRDSALDALDGAMAAIARKPASGRIHERLAEAAGVALEGSSYQVIRCLADPGPIRASELAARMGLDLSTVSRQVAHLESEGLVERRPDPLDRRASLLALSDGGRLASARICEARRSLFAEALSDWAPEDIELLAGLLSRFAEAMASLADRQPPAEPDHDDPTEEPA